MTKNDIADRLTEIGTLLELKGENPFKIRAYQTGARAVESLEEAELAQRVGADTLDEVKGIGEALAEKISELFRTGRLDYFEKLKGSIEPGLVEMLDVPGLGSKKVRALHDRLKISDIPSLEKACREGKVARLEGFGEKSQEKILSGIRHREAYGRRHLWWDADAIAAELVAGLRKLKEVSQAEAAGSLRRGLETVGDLDILVAAQKSGPVVDWFVSRDSVQEVTARGETKASVRFETGLQADLRLVPKDQFVYALHHFTGSKDHNVQMRQRALARGLSLSEWGLVPATGEGTVKQKTSGTTRKRAPRNEEELFGELGLPYIPPELREGLGEIEAAERGELPALIEHKDIRGAFHNHTTASDGRNTLKEMAAAAADLGWEYLGIADHSKSSFQANGLDEEAVEQQLEEIGRYNAAKGAKIHLFAGTECDILPDGRLDFDAKLLARLDYVVVSIHSAFAQDEKQMTKRIIRAIEHPHVTMLGHLTGRLLLRREGYAVNVGKVIDAAIANRVIIELNANPWRLDMDWRYWRRAAERGLHCAINPDAHDTEGLKHVAAGVNAARKGWLTAEQVLNTRTRAQVAAYLRKSGKAK